MSSDPPPLPPTNYMCPIILFYFILLYFTFCSISNLGMFPVDCFCAIINPPQVYDNLRFSESFCLYIFHYYQYQRNYGLSFCLDTWIKSLISLPNHSHLWFRYLTISIEYGFIKGPLCTPLQLGYEWNNHRMKNSSLTQWTRMGRLTQETQRS